MALEMVLNELSVLTPAEDIPTAQQRMSDFIDTVRTATTYGVKRVLRTKEDFQSTILAPDYPIVRWRNDSSVDREARRFLTALATKSPFLTDISDPEIENSVDLSEFKHQGVQAYGLGIAYLRDALSVSLISEPCWDNKHLKIEFRYIDEDEEVIDEIVEITHASRGNHVREHVTWIKERIRTKVNDGIELWHRRLELFPHLEFCERVSKQIECISAGDPMLRQVMKRLRDLEDYCNIWIDGYFDYDQLPCNISPERDSRLNQFKQKLTIECPDGKMRVFSLHTRMTPGAWRLHFCVELGPGKIVIGYIGSKIQ